MLINVSIYLHIYKFQNWIMEKSSVMDRWQGKVAVVTGANSGIGYATAKSLIERGVLVVGVDLRKDRLDELCNQLHNTSGKLFPIGVDITKECDILDAFKWIKENVGPIHILINCAGIARVASLIDGKTEFWRQVFDTNVIGLCIATREAIKDMRANKVAGHIIHINSIAGHKVPRGALIHIYAASKHSVTALTETLRQELNSIGSKIKITSISPGQVATDFVENFLVGSGRSDLLQNTQEMLNTHPALQASDVADAIIFALATSEHVQIHELIITPVNETH